MARKSGNTSGIGLKRMLAAVLTVTCFVGMSTANAALLQLTGGVWQTTPAQVIGDVTAGNDVITTPVYFWDNATISTNEAVELKFYYVGAESGYTNTLNVTGGGTHADDNSVPGSWSNPLLFSITLGAGQAVPMSFSAMDGASPVISSLAPGGGIPLGGDNFDKSIGFAILDCTTGSPACFSIDPSLHTGNIIAFMLDDGGANQDDNHDDYVGYMVATSTVPLPAAAWLLFSGAGLLGAAVRRRRA